MSRTDRKLKMAAGLAAATFATLALPGLAAGAEYLVPPDNSAATQYTETYPSAGGQKDAENQRGNRNRSPEKALGKRNARRLERHGPEGEAVAELVAETAPEPTPPTGVAAADGEGAGDHRDQQAGGGGDNPGGGKFRSDPPSSPPLIADLNQRGASGFGQILSGAVGAPAGGSGAIIIPLAVLATLAWALAHAWQQRKKQSA